MRTSTLRTAFLALFLASLLSVSAALGASTEEQIWIHRNLGKAFYENPTTQYEAVGELQKALALAPDSAVDRVNYGLALLRAGQEEKGVVELEKAQEQDPSLPHTWFNLGIAYKRESRYAEARAQLEQMVKLVPGDAIAHFNLGVLYKLDGRLDLAIRHLERSGELDPNLAGPHFQLATVYRQAKDVAASKREMARFREIKKRLGESSEDLEWSWYSELQEARLPEHAADTPTTSEPRFARTELAEGFGGDAASTGLASLDLDGDGGTDLLAWSAGRVAVFRDARREVDAGLGPLVESLGGASHLAAADFDNDGLTDLVAVGGAEAKAPALWRNVGGRFAAHPATLPAGRFARAAWIDDDHDGDLDLFLLGHDAARVRNRGAAGFAEETGGFPFVDGVATSITPYRLVTDTQSFDFVVLYADRPAVLYRDRLQGRYTAEPLPALPRNATRAASVDLDHDGWTDLVASGPDGLVVLHNQANRALLDRVLRPVPLAAVSASGGGGTMVLADLRNRGVDDLLTPAGLHTNQGRLRFASPTRVEPLSSVRTALAADWNGNGRLDLAAVDRAGRLLRLDNETPGGGFVRLRLEGVKNPPLAPGAVVEIKAGTHYQMKTYAGVPLHFGLGSAEQADTLRITWPNGSIQNQTRQPAGSSPAVKEAQRLSGSCPMVFTWNGESFEFVTDVLGVAPLGAAAGGGEVFPVDHDEYIWIEGDSLRAENGRYEIRITEELREIAYLDQIELIAVDHPADWTVVHNDKFKAPPFPEFRLFGAAETIRPSAARDHLGRDVLPRLVARDATYVDGFRRDFAGVAEMHGLELRFEADDPSTLDHAVLVLSGWVDWADGSTFLGLAQESERGLVLPSLEMKTAAGEWVTVLDDMGIPAGKPKTIAVDLSGLWPSDARELRIVTNLALYWDEAFLLPSADEPPAHLHPMAAASAELRFRGFSRPVVHPQRLQPERFVYADWQPHSMWNPTPGRYTRYGTVDDLLAKIDDRLVIMGSGDELRLLFDAEPLPPVARGWTRNFLLFVDGWAKDGDANTAHATTVMPLPFHGMSRYPYGPGDTYPRDERLQRDLEERHVRPALRLLRPLVGPATRSGLRPLPGRAPADPTPSDRHP